MILGGWQRKHRIIARRVRKQHPFKPWVQVAWLVPFLITTWFYYHLFELVDGWGAMVYFMLLQVLYFYTVVFVLLPAAYYVKQTWVAVALHVAILFLGLMLFALIMVGVSVYRGMLVIRFDFSAPFAFDIINIGEMAFLYLGFAPVNALSFFYIERFFIKKRKVQRLWYWYQQANERLTMLNTDWLSWQMQPHLMANLMTTLRDAARSAKPHRLVRATTYVGNLMAFYTKRALDMTPFTLREEMNQVKLLLAIHRLAGTRGGAARYIKLVVAHPVPDIAILPMTVLVLIENIFCHATRIDKHHQAEVIITAVAGGVCITAENAFDSQAPRPVSDHGHGVAIRNIRQRLHQTHPEATLQTSWPEGRFRATIFIPTDFISLSQSN